jgi:deoxyribonuclease (pyrimidine dimer)
MTRINSAIPVTSLTDEHLLAEHREIKRIPTHLREHIDKIDFEKLPDNFRLGTGHVMFFLKRGIFTYNRYMELLAECKKRGFEVGDYSKNWEIYAEPDNFIFQLDHIPDDLEYLLLIDRISERIINSPKPNWHYYGKAVTREKAIEILKRK